MKKIDNPDHFTICEWDSVNSCGVYLGGLDRLVRVNNALDWRVDQETKEFCECDGKVLTLKEIADQLSDEYGANIITVIIISPLSGSVLQYGNYGDEWWEVGTLNGYA